MKRESTDTVWHCGFIPTRIIYLYVSHLFCFVRLCHCFAPIIDIDYFCFPDSSLLTQQRQRFTTIVVYLYAII